MTTQRSRKRGRKHRNKTKRRQCHQHHQRGGDSGAGAPPVCSPKPKGAKKSFTCYTDDGLKKLKDAWNKRAVGARDTEKITATQSKDIHRDLAANLRNKCATNEACWLDALSPTGGAEIAKASFAPESPASWDKNPNEWLSSDEIEDVMEQFEAAYPCFEFIGPSPIDFDARSGTGCVWKELCKFSMADKIRQGKFKIGMIFNTDKHTGPGQHWISMFVNARKSPPTIFYFDSTGDDMPAQIRTLVDRIVAQGATMRPPLRFVVDSNEGVEHQYGNTECGVYSLFFIVHMLEDKITANYLKTHILKDKYMEKFRRVYFNRAGVL